MKYIWDTNTVIYYLQQLFPENVDAFVDNLLDEFPENVDAFVDNLLDESLPFISAITQIELLCWKNATEVDLKQINGFISDSTIIELDNLVKLETVNILKVYSLKLPDAIIAASALAYDSTLITRNIKDFKKIENLKLLSPWEQE